MSFQNVITLLGGIAMFIFGMNKMSDSLKDMAGSYLKKILAKLTEKRIVAVLVGAGLTALIQSSNAMCSMAVGFVNAGLMDLERTFGIILGAKLGTTITGQLIAIHIYFQFSVSFSCVLVLCAPLFHRSRSLCGSRR